MDQMKSIKRNLVAQRVFYALVWTGFAVGICWFIYVVTEGTVVTAWVAIVLTFWTGTFLWRSLEFDKRVHALFGLVPKTWSAEREDYVDDHSTFHRETATIAFDLIPRLDKFLTSRCRLVIVGSDCHPITIKKYPWRDFMERCLRDKQCKVIQYVSHGEHESSSFLNDLEEKFPGLFERRELVDPERISKVSDRKLIEALQTFHPTLAWNDYTGEKVMWIERYHPPNSQYAYGCDYYDAKALKEREEGFTFYQDKLEEAWNITQAHSAAA